MIMKEIMLRLSQSDQKQTVLIVRTLMKKVSTIGRHGVYNERKSILTRYSTL